jgi:hypothetical protein
MLVLCSPSPVSRPGPVRVFSSKACFVEPTRPAQVDGSIIHHGDDYEPAFSCHLVKLNSKSTSRGEEIPLPWTNGGTIDVDYVIKASTGAANGLSSTDPRLKRVLMADDDARQLHHAHIQRDCKILNFQSVLDESNFGGESKEKVICQLTCKAILNLASLSGLKRDMVGECSAILTECIDPSNRYRRIYFVQASRCICSFPFL